MQGRNQAKTHLLEELSELRHRNAVLENLVKEHKQAEKIQPSLYKISEAVLSSENLEELYQIIHETITEIMPAKNNFYIALYDEDTGMLTFPYFVDEFEERPGPEKLGKGLTEYVLKTEKPLLASPQIFEELVKKGEVVSVGPPSIDWLGVPLKTKDKTIGVLVVQSYTEGLRYTEEEKNILMFISEQVALAIERKQAQENIKQLQEYLQLQIDRMPIALIVWDLEFRATSWNPAAEKIFGFTAKEALGKHPYGLIVPEEAQPHVDKIWNRLLEGDETAHSVNENITKDGRTIICDWSNTPFKKADGSVLGVLSMTQDITERTQAEERIKASLKEKEVLLREIHHRVKNNMQIMSSLLRLQFAHVKSKKTREMTREYQSRIHSMAYIHEKLYRSKDFNRINFGQYIQSLNVHLMHTYSIRPNIIKIKLDVRDILLDINKAIPCGLIFNELFSNSLRHAFPEGQKGQISIKLSGDKQGKTALVISDNGVGIPESVDIKNPQTLGLQLVDDLTKQINGAIELDREGGTTFKITF